MAHIGDQAEWWLTTADGASLLERQNSLLVESFDAEVDDEMLVTIDTEARYQVIEGFGASFTETASWLLREQLSPEQRASLLTELLDPVLGIGMNFIRQPIGATDIARGYYSYDDMPAGEDDFALEHFTLEPDRAHILPVLKEVLLLGTDVTVLGTPWSPPAWMRTDQSMRGADGGQLRPEAYAAYATYFAKFLEGYAEEGIDVQYVTVQNEPLYQPHYPGMLLPASDEATFIRDHLGPTLRDRGLDTKILVHDHNWSDWEYAAEILSDPGAASFIAGTAFHRYGGSADAGSIIHERFPTKDIFFTEGSTDVTIGIPFIVGQVIIGSLRNWARSIVLWNVLADERNGPYMKEGGCAICRPMTSLDTVTKTWKHNPDYYALAHVSKFVRRGAVRVASSQNVYSTLLNVALRNPDGSIVLLVLNQGMVPHDLRVRVGDTQFQAVIPVGGAATFVLPA